jgi:hypothetical protein
MRAPNPSRRWALVMTIGFVARGAAFLLAVPATAAAAPTLTVTPTELVVLGTASNPISSTLYTITGSGFAPGIGTMHGPSGFVYNGVVDANGGFTMGPTSWGQPENCFSGSSTLVWTFVDGLGGTATSNTVTLTINPGGGDPGALSCPVPVDQNDCHHGSQPPNNDDHHGSQPPKNDDHHGSQPPKNDDHHGSQPPKNNDRHDSQPGKSRRN